MKNSLASIYSACVFITLLSWSCAVSADVFVSSEKDKQILQMNADGKLIRSIATCLRPRHMAWIKGEKYISGALSDAIATGESPEIFSLSPDFRKVYMSIEDGSQMAAYDVGSKSPLFSVKTGPQPEGVLASTDGKSVYVTSEVANAVYAVDVAKGKIVGQVKVGLRPRRLALSSDGGELWITNELGSSVSLVDTRSMSVKHTLVFQIADM